MRNYLHYIFLALISLFLVKASEAQVLDELKLNPELITYVEDSDRLFCIDSVGEVVFQNIGKEGLNLGFFDGVLWVKIDLTSLKIDNQSLLELENPNLDDVIVYVKSGDKYEFKGKFGDYYPFSDREINHRNYQIGEVAGREVLLMINNHGDQLLVPLNFGEKDLYNQRDYKEQMIIGAYYGLIMFVLLLNLFLFLVIREKSNLYYILYLFGLILLQLGLSGHGFEFIWSDSKFVANKVLPFASSFSVLFLVYFTRSFFQTKEHLKKMDVVFRWTGYVLILTCIVSLLPFKLGNQISIVVVNVFTLILNVIIFPTAILTWKRNKRISQIFILAFAFLIFSVIILVLRNMGLIADNFFTKYSFQLGTATEVILLSFAIVEKFKSFKDQALGSLKEVNQLKESQNETLQIEIEKKTKLLEENYRESELKSKEIYDSINYAKRIQSGLIPSIEHFQSFFKESFIEFRPKDVLSGDFYWIAQTQTTADISNDASLIVFAVGDCTGHGVPGAMISVLGIKILNASLKNPEINSTAEALDYLDREVATTFGKDINDKQIADGMDIAICALNPKTNELYFSGAKNGVWILRDGEIIDYKGDRDSIGGDLNTTDFTIQTIQMEKGDKLYIQSDGFVDQFGGERGKKYKSKNLKQFFANMSDCDIHEQGERLSTEINTWIEGHEQVDDISIIGIQF
jgi:serine phosphatase RsbU (regulator of sigma subunit)